ncbi:hypothetical protein CDEST_08172 [Colletotrichum destructivum]|uniref:Uncharacterized protein n=1 Tax=Colletotrichum destructivum TaxID=34406 RepID=A0AAX4IJG6_9PEZI|nr:hypothetical protein CDEST_08172 [Colletotrichum destructivum]
MVIEMENWNAVKAILKKPWIHLHPQAGGCLLPLGTHALLHLSQAPFRKLGDSREWATITPLVIQSYYEKGAWHVRRVPMFTDGYSRVTIPAAYIRIDIRVLRDFVPGVPEYDEIAARGAVINRGVSIFRKGDIATLDDFTMYPPCFIEVRCPRRTLEGVEAFPGLYPIHRSFVQLGLPPDPERNSQHKL